MIQLAIGIILCLGNCSGNKALSTNQESGIIAQSNSPFAIDGSNQVYQATVKLQRPISGSGKTFLQLLEPRVSEFPEGVIEVYLSRVALKRSELNSKRAEFVNVLDLFSFSGDDRLTELDLTAALTRLEIKGDSSLYLTILFRGNSLPTGNESTNAGRTSFKGFVVRVAG